MEMKAVKSSNISKVGYDAEKQKMRIQFSTGKEYDYENVSQKDHDDMVGSDSIGRHFGQNIRGNKDFALKPEKEEMQRDLLS